ncbi:uncharacterized protein ACMZJ9_019956 [Mantella aurantiaca]
MDARFSHEDKTRKRWRLRRMCSLCNEPCRDADEQMRHYSSALHKHMKRVKRKQYSYTKNLKSLDEKIKASEEQKEPLIGLEYIYQYAADRRGVVPYVCLLCNCVYKINTIFFHIAGIKHRSVYLSKNFPAMGFDRNFSPRTSADFRRLHTAAEIIEKTHGRRKINISNAFFNPKKKVGVTYDSNSEDEGLSSSEDEQDNPGPTLTNSANYDNNNRSVNRSGNVPFQHDLKGGPLLPNVGRGDPAFRYDGRRGPEVQDGLSDVNRPLRDHDASGFHFDGYSDRSYREDNDHQPMEPSYQQRGPDRKVPGRTDFPGDHHPGSQMQRDGTAFQYDDGHGRGGVMGQNRTQSHPLGYSEDRNLGSQMHRVGMEYQYDKEEGPLLQGGPRHTGNQGRNNNHDFAFQRDQNTRSLGDPHGGHDLQTPMHRGGAGFQYDDKEGPLLQGGHRSSGGQVRNDDREFAFQYGESTRLVDNPHGDFDMQSIGPLHQKDRNGVKSQNRTQDRPPSFFGGLDLGSQQHRDGMASQYDDRRGPIVQGGHQLKKDDRDLGYQRLPLPRNAHGNLNIPPLPQRVDPGDFESQNRTQNHPSGFFGNRDLQSTMHQGGREFQYDDKRGLQGGLQVREKNEEFSFKHDQSTRLIGGPREDPNMPSMGPLHHQVDSGDFKSRGRTQSHPSGFPDALNPPMHRDGMAFHYDDSQRPTLQGGSRLTDSQVKNDGRGFAFQHDPSPRLQGSSQGDLGRDDLRGFSGDRDLGSRMHRDGAAFQYDDRRGPLLQDGPRNADGQVRNNDLAFRRDQSRRSHDEAQVPALGRVDHDGILRGGKSFRGTGDQGVNYDSDMEVCSMELSEADPDEFLCNAELFEFVKTFQIQSYEDEQFALKVRDFFTNGSVRYKNHKEEALRRRIAQEKEKLEEEKKAFLEIQKSKGRPKKEHVTAAPKRNQAPDPSSHFPVAAPDNTGLAGRPLPLMGLVIGRHSGQKESVEELRSPSMPAKNRRPEYQSRWNQEPIQAPSETRLAERSNQPPPRGDLFPSRGHSEGSRNVPSRFSAHTGSMKY